MNFNISNLASAMFGLQGTTTVNNTNNVANKQNFTPSPSNESLLSSMSNKQVENLYFQVTNATANIMNNAQQNMFLRDMLGLPKDWTNLLKEFAYSDNSQIANLLKTLSDTNQSTINNALLQLLSSNAKINLLLLAEHLNSNSALMADKLLKYMGAANMTQNNIAQLKELMMIGASIANNASVNPQEFIRDIVQMYLPWLPLVPPKDEDLNEIEATTGKEENNNGQVLFYISTTNLGYFKIEIVTENKTEVYINNISDISDSELKKSLSDKLKTNINHVSKDAKLFFSIKIDDEKTNLNEKQLYIVKSDNTMIGMTLIQLISKVIFEFDDKEAMRFKKANNEN